MKKNNSQKFINVQYFENVYLFKNQKYEYKQH